MIKIYCDGSCSNNGYKPNFGGYGIVITFNDKIIKTINGNKINTTNNEMELTGVLESIKIAKVLKGKEVNKPIKIYSDSAYVVNTVNSWMYSWYNNGWIKKTDKKTPENLNLIKEIYNLMLWERYIQIEKIKGHNGDKFHDLADELAKKTIDKLELEYLNKSNFEDILEEGE